MNNKDKSSISLKAARMTGRSALSLAKMTGKAGWALAKPIGKLSVKGGRALTEHATVICAKYELSHKNYTDENFYEKGAITFENLVDALLNEKSGTSARIVHALSVKLGAAGATAGIFSIASLLGTASTGTAISSLSGAAFSNAALAWIGGSVATGGGILLGVAAIGSAAAYYGSRKMLSKWVGKRREKKSLDSQERQLVETCLMLATAFRKQAKNNARLDPITARALHQNLSHDLMYELDESIGKLSDWPYRPLNRLKCRREELQALLGTLAKVEQGHTGVRNESVTTTPVLTGVVSATMMKLMASELPKFNGDEQIVLEALRRSNNSLSDASDLQLSEYVKSLSMEQVAGLKNNVKGIYHELAFQNHENLNGDEYIVELLEDTNHPGADVRIINVETGEVAEVQLKATNYASYVREHSEKYEDIDVLVTSEVAGTSSEWSSSGFSNADLTTDTTSTLNTLARGIDEDIAESMNVSAMVTLAINARLMLNGEALSTRAKQKMIQNGVVAASVAGLVQLIL